jgi:hypothetical protein
MQNGFIGLRTLAFAALFALVGCGDPGDASGGGGSAGSGGAGSGGAGLGGAGSGGAGSGGAGSGGLGGAGLGAAGSGGAGLGGAGSGGGSSGSAGSGTASTCTKDQGGTVVTGLCGDAPLNTLTPAEITQLCDDTNAYVGGSVSKQNACKYSALLDAASSSSPTEVELQAYCSDAENACNQDAASMGPGALCGQVPSTCSATVAQYSVCIVDETALFEQGVSELVSCSMMTFDDVTSIYDVSTDADDAAGCMALMTACPNYFPPYIN